MQQNFFVWWISTTLFFLTEGSHVVLLQYRKAEVGLHTVTDRGDKSKP